MKKEESPGKGNKAKPKTTTLFTVIFSLLLVICSLFTACDLLNAPTDPDYFQKIDEEIAWANAPRLTVHLSYDPEWGTSNPAMGQITPARDIRQGYAL